MYFIQFNEANFDIIKKYIYKYPNKFKNLETIVSSNKFLETTSEKEYKFLEPWIQWPSLYTGLKANQHNIFRLGDVEKRSDLRNFFNEIDDMGKMIGFISPMNLINNFNNSPYFIPDPWTKTKVTGNFFIKSLYKTLSYSVNNNSSGKIGFKNFILFLFAVIFFSKFKYWYLYLKLAFNALLLKKKWNKALFLDLFIHNLNISLKNKFKPHIGVVFFNSLAHVQHHYFLNSKLINPKKKNPDWYIDSKHDPIKDALITFDKIFEYYLNSNEKLFIATALSQSPANKPVFYYRLKDHKKFLNKFNIHPKEILPRMTRDFTLNYENESDCKISENLISNIKLNNEKVFDIDNRGTSLFVTLIYPKEINKHDFFECNVLKINAYENISFVAIKNGIHDQKGYVYSNLNNIDEKSNIQNIFQIKDFLSKYVSFN